MFTPYVVKSYDSSTAIVFDRKDDLYRIIRLGSRSEGKHLLKVEQVPLTFEREFKPIVYDVRRAARIYLESTTPNVTTEAERILRKLSGTSRRTTMSELNTPTPATKTPTNGASAPKPVKTTAKIGADAKKPSPVKVTKPAPAPTKKTPAKKAPAKKPAPTKKTPAKKAAKKGGGAGRKPTISDDAKITVVAKENPMRDGSQAYKWFALLKTGMTFGDALKKGISRPYLMAWVNQDPAPIKVK